MDDIDRAVRHILTLKFASGLFDDRAIVPVPENAGKGVLDSPAHRQLALEAATQGVVLLQNGIQKSTSSLATHGASPASASASSPPLSFSASPAPVLPITNLASQKVALFGPVAKDEGVRPFYIIHAPIHTRTFTAARHVYIHEFTRAHPTGTRIAPPLPRTLNLHPAFSPSLHRLGTLP